jgi:hypothetical protein
MEREDDITTFNEWFDINKLEHLRAYAHFRRTSNWPKHFIPADVKLEHNPNWQELLDLRIIDHYLNMKISPVYRGDAITR